MASIFAVIFFLALGIAVAVAGIQLFLMATTQQTCLMLCTYALLAIACVAGGITLACVPWSVT